MNALTCNAKAVFAPIATESMTIAAVASAITRQVRGTGLEPEWLLATNYENNEDEARFGLKCSRPWPELGARDRLAISVNRGWSEGWIVHVDLIQYVTHGHDGSHVLRRLLYAKALVRDRAWELAQAITQMLDVA